MNGEDGFGGIFPPMVYSYEMMVLLGYPRTIRCAASARTR
jgi:hypothetical protein